MTASAGSATATSSSSSSSSSSRRPNKADARRLTAEERQAHQRATKDLKKRVQQLERQIAKAETEVAKLSDQLAQPEIYDDHAKVRELADALDVAKATADRLLEEWETAQLRLEAASE